jgi:hypothetical protein
MMKQEVFERRCSEMKERHAIKQDCDVVRLPPRAPAGRTIFGKLRSVSALVIQPHVGFSALTLMFDATARQPESRSFPARHSNVFSASG